MIPAGIDVDIISARGTIFRAKLGKWGHNLLRGGFDFAPVVTLTRRTCLRLQDSRLPLVAAF